MPKRIEDEKLMNTIQRSVLEAEVIEALRSVFDPEIPVNIYDLGLIYDVSIDDDAFAQIKMTLTSPACPVAESLPIEVQHRVAQTPGLNGANVEVVWDPPFTIDRIPEHVRLDLGFL